MTQPKSNKTLKQSPLQSDSEIPVSLLEMKQAKKNNQLRH